MIVKFFGFSKLQLSQIKRELEKEHEGYYGTPHGYRETLPAQGFPVDTGEEVFFPCGFFEEGNSFGWVRSSGAWIVFSPSRGIALFSGRRHAFLSLLELFPYMGDVLLEKRWEYIITSQPTWDVVEILSDQPVGK